MKICSGANYGRVLIGAAGPGAQLDVYDATDLKANGDDIGLQVNEEINDNDSANYFNNRAIAAELYAKNGTQTIGISNTVDNYNTTLSSGIKLQGMYITVRDLNGTSGTDYADGIVIDNYVTSNLAEQKTGIQAIVGSTSSSVTNTLNT